MAAIYRMISLGKNIVFEESKRSFSLSPISKIKEIVTTKKDNVLTIEGKIIPNEKYEQLLIKRRDNGCCSICSLNLNIKHTDVMIISQFVRSDGCMLPRRITGLCKIQQVRVTKMVAMAQKAGLMPNLTPSIKKKEPHMRYQWKAFNTYYDETTIKHRYPV